MKNTLQKGSGAIWAIVLVAIAVVVTVISIIVGKQSPKTPEVVTDTTIPVSGDNATTTPVAIADKKFIYKNGTYTATGDYNSPGGSESIKLTVTVKDDVVTDATVVPQATIPASVHFQGIFVSNFKQFVIGKNIADIQLDKVAGSSLTPAGFNNALEKIKTEAKV